MKSDRLDIIFDIIQITNKLNNTLQEYVYDIFDDFNIANINEHIHLVNRTFQAYGYPIYYKADINQTSGSVFVNFTKDSLPLLKRIMYYD